MNYIFGEIEVETVNWQNIITFGQNLVIPTLVGRGGSRKRHILLLHYI